ncbi:recombinase family protein [Nocardioides salarius]|uniref:recombinase family protein n=1 Tax=Nocardioides salarius TaxID=374513 RepID=UPI0030FA4567
MSTPTAAAVYTRISADIEGLGLGVARQREDCEKLAAHLGWPVARVYSDNDVSAYSGKTRPEYQQMLEDLRNGEVDAVIVYHPDRLTRRPLELEQFIQALDAAKVRHVKFVSGDADFTTGDGLLVLRMLSAVAAAESASKSRRVKRKQEQNAAAGLPHRGSTRPFGYEPDHITIREDEAQVYRRLVERFLAGESYRSLAAWLDSEQVPTVRGGGWMSTTVRGLLINPRYAGLLVRHQQVVGLGVWEGIISEDQHRQVLAKIAERSSSGRRAPQRYLLSGLCRCGRCGGKLFSAARGETRRYECRKGPDHKGCGGLTVTALRVELLVVDQVLYRLDTPELADTLAGRASADAQAAEWSRVVDQATVQLEELAAAYGQGQIMMGEWMVAKKPITARLEQAQRQLANATHSTALLGLVGNGGELRGSWGDLNLDRQHRIIEALVDHVEIAPHTSPGSPFDPTRVRVVWRR